MVVAVQNILYRPPSFAFTQLLRQKLEQLLLDVYKTWRVCGEIRGLHTPDTFPTTLFFWTLGHSFIFVRWMCTEFSRDPSRHSRWFGKLGFVLAESLIKSAHRQQYRL